ncbi:hypothetical protein D3C78_1023840 [compost metagenome]
MVKAAATIGIHEAVYGWTQNLRAQQGLLKVKTAFYSRHREGYAKIDHGIPFFLKLNNPSKTLGTSVHSERYESVVV